MAKKIKKAEAPAKEQKKAKKALTPEQIEKRKARMEAIKNRPQCQRPNSKQVDIIELENGSKVMNFAYAIRKTGVLVTSVMVDAKGNPVSTALEFIPGCKAKSKKLHGTIIPGVAGMGKGQEDEVEEDEAQEEDED